IVLLLLFCVFIYSHMLDLVKTRRADPLAADIEDNPLLDTRSEGRVPWLLVPAGLLLLLLGGELTIRNGVAYATSLGVSPAIVGLFMVAVGTSMPELVTTIVAALRRESDLALGNIVGSNIFNSLVVLPASGLISQIPIPRGGIIDLLFSLVLAAFLVLVFFLGKARMGRITGGILLVAYFTYMAVRVASS
ncbi:MAG: sodium:calcium antiporter, partial [Gammaproteobacteria bacterium]|nr:sodium:calcium antiporter [Gammaproteobacteria bacterium]